MLTEMFLSKFAQKYNNSLFKTAKTAIIILALPCIVVIDARAGQEESTSIRLPEYSQRETPSSEDWSVVTAPGEPNPDDQIPLRPGIAEECPLPAWGSESGLIPGGQTRLPDAEETVPPAILPEMTPLQRPGAEEDFLDIVHGSISYGFLATATWLDSFFGNEQYEAEDNLSRFKFRYILFKEKDTSLEYRPDIDLRLMLPQMKKKTYLIISGDPNEDIETSSSPAALQRNQLPRPEDRNVTTALQYFFKTTERRSYSVKAGASIHSGKPVIFLGPRMRYFRRLNPLDFRLIEEILWFTDTGWVSRTRFDLERTLPRDLFFRTSLEGIWTEDEPGYPYSWSFTLLQPLDRNRALSYEWVNSFQTEPSYELDEVLFALRYRQRVWRDWLYFELAPQERFPRDRDFSGTPGIMFKLEMIVGDYKSFIF